VYPLAPSLDTVGPLGADMAAVELGMGLIEPGFAAGSCELIAGRMRPEVDVDPMTDAAVDAALAAAGVRVTEVAGFGFRACAGATNALIDAEAYQANAYLIPHLDRLTPQLRRTVTEAAAITADQVEAARRVRREASDWFAAALDHYPVLALPTLVGAPPLLGERGMPLTVLTMPANLAGLPTLSLPVPGGPAGLSASLQLIGPPGGEERLIALGRVIEAALRGR
jgi:amidase